MGADVSRRAGHFFTPKAAMLAFLFVGVTAAAQTERVLYYFKSEVSGVAPESGLVQDKTGALYGTTTSVSTVFKLTPPVDQDQPWTETEIYTFSAFNDGFFPVDAGHLVFDESGNLYGTTTVGGDEGYGTVFRLTPPSSGTLWRKTILYNFGGGTDAQYPVAAVILAGGTLYGTTSGGGEFGAGTVFRLTPTRGSGAWKETVLHSFTGGSDGGSPMASPTAGPGVLYGTTAGGGLDGSGVVYQLRLQQVILPSGRRGSFTIFPTAATTGATHKQPFPSTMMAVSMEQLTIHLALCLTVWSSS